MISIADLKKKITSGQDLSKTMTETVTIPLTPDQAKAINSAMASAEFALEALDPFSAFLGEDAQDAMDVGICFASGYNDKVALFLTKAAADGKLTVSELLEIGIASMEVYKGCAKELEELKS